jgi:hypothetical protein
MLETAEIERWRRMTAAMLRHAAEDDPEAFAQVVEILDDARDQLPLVAQALRAKADPLGTSYLHGFSWSHIGAALGVTRQAAQQRFGTVR